MTGQLPAFGLNTTPISKVIEETNATGSSVVLMIETRESIKKIDEIAAVSGVEVLLIGSNDLSIELQVPGQFTSPEFREALEAVSKACKKRGKVMGLAGIYENPEIQNWAIKELGVGYILGQQDSGLLARSTKEVVHDLGKIATGV
jgi:2-keto-3-deoxy-L-rhamnonate aldolase RhmA